MAGTKQVLFHVGNELYGISILNVKAIEKYVNILPVPNAPSYIEGVINLRGEVIPVYSLRTKFGLAKREPNEETKLIIANANNYAIAFVVDKVKEIIEIPDEQLSETPKIVEAEETAYIGQIAMEKNQLIILLNLDGIMNMKEKSKIEEILKQED